MTHTLLLADDSPTIHRVIELTFADEDISVVAVDDGDKAIASIDRLPPDIVLADIGMPVGLTFAGRAYDDTALLGFAAAFEATGERRTPPPRTPPL